MFSLVRRARIASLLISLLNFVWMVTPGAAMAQSPQEAVLRQRPALAAAGQPSHPSKKSNQALNGTSEGVFGSSLWGGHGIHRLASAFALRPGALALTVSDNFYAQSHVFLPNDQDRQSQQGIDVMFAPVLGLELSASSRALAHRYRGEFERNLQTLGNPTFRAKYARQVVGALALGMQAEWLLPTSAQGTGLSPAASTYTLLAVGSVMLGRHVELVANVGFSYDRSRFLFATEQEDPVQALAYQVNRTSQVPYGVGAQARLSLGRWVLLVPFAELTGAVGTSHAASRKNNPLRVSLGAKIFPSFFPVAELGVGVDLAASGRASSTSPYGGQPLWNVFGRATVHIDNLIGRPAAGTAKSCQSISDCLDGGECVANQCVPAGTVAQATYTVSGSVIDSQSRAAVLSASLEVDGYEGTVLAANEDDGHYRLWPLPCGEGLVRIVAHAPGYVPVEKIVRKSPDKRELVVDFEMAQDMQKPSFATFKLSLRDVETGKAVPRGNVRFVADNKLVQTDVRGALASRVKPGSYQVIISSPGYSAQRRTVIFRPGSTLILNVDLERTAAAR